MILMHLRSNDGLCLCGVQSDTCLHINTYIRYLNPRSYRWCPDCVKHPDLVMVVLNYTNV